MIARNPHWRESYTEERCGVCARALVGCSFVRTDLGESMCQSCQRSSGAVCDDCGQCVRREWSLKQRQQERLCGVGISGGGGSKGVSVDGGGSETDGGSRGRRTARRQSGGEAVIGQCESCATTAVQSDAEAAAILDCVILAMAAMGALGAPEGRIPLQLVDADRYTLNCMP